MIKLEYVTVLPGELCSAFYIDERDRRNTNPLYQTLSVNGKLYLKLKKSLSQSKRQADKIKKLYNLPVSPCDCIYPKGRIKLISKSDFDKFSETEYCGTFDYLMPLSQLADDRNFDTRSISLNELSYSDEITEFLTLSHQDRKWLCDQAAKISMSLDSGCVDSFRVSHVNEDGTWSEQYESEISCCMQIDEKMHNPETGNCFWIGFNYDH